MDLQKEQICCQKRVKIVLHKIEFLISNVEFKADIIENIDIGTILVMTIRI